MNNINYQYKDQNLTASFVEQFSNEQMQTIVITLGNGKQAFFKSVSSNNLIGCIWEQELYTEHEVWPPELVKALSDSLNEYKNRTKK